MGCYTSMDETEQSSSASANSQQVATMVQQPYRPYTTSIYVVVQHTWRQQHSVLGQLQVASKGDTAFTQETNSISDARDPTRAPNVVCRQKGKSNILLSLKSPPPYVQRCHTPPVYMYQGNLPAYIACQPEPALGKDGKKKGPIQIHYNMSKFAPFSKCIVQPIYTNFMQYTSIQRVVTLYPDKPKYSNKHSSKTI